MAHESMPTTLDTGYNHGFEPDIGLELIDEVMHAGSELDAELAAFGYEAAGQIYGDERESPALQEKYGLGFDPEVAVRGVGGTALAVAMSPEIARHTITEQAFQTLAKQPTSEYEAKKQ